MSKAATDRGHLDLIDDLIDIDMGLYIIKLLGTEFEDIGIQLALHSGALLTESFSERVGSCVNNIKAARFLVLATSRRSPCCA